jgi:hypothetical protein
MDEQSDMSESPARRLLTSERERKIYDDAYASGRRDGVAVGFWEGYNEAVEDLKSLGVIDGKE